MTCVGGVPLLLYVAAAAAAVVSVECAIQAIFATVLSGAGLRCGCVPCCLGATPAINGAFRAGAVGHITLHGRETPISAIRAVSQRPWCPRKRNRLQHEVPGPRKWHPAPLSTCPEASLEWSQSAHPSQLTV
jgi:hypothetical protein